MENILTKEEIEALLSAVFEGRIDPEKELAKASGRISNYDLFGTDNKRGHVPNLDIVYDSFIRYTRVGMSNRLRKLVEIKKLGAQALKFDDFLQTLPSPVCLGIFKMEPLKGAALVAMDSMLVFTMVDSILGGAGKPKIPENRMFTSIELRLIERLTKDMLVDMEKSWAPLQATQMSLIKLEVNPRLVNIVPLEYQVVTMNLQFQIEESVGNMTFAIPYMTIDPLRDKLKSGTQVEMMAIDPQWAFRLSNGLLDAPLELTVEMGSAVISMDELLDLVPGDTIMLDKPSQNDLLVKVGDIGKFIGIPGARHGNKAVQITKVLHEGGRT